MMIGVSKDAAVSWETGRNQVSGVVAGSEHEMAETVHHEAGETAVQPGRRTPEPQIKAAKNRGIFDRKIDGRNMKRNKGPRNAEALNRSNVFPKAQTPRDFNREIGFPSPPRYGCPKWAVRFANRGREPREKKRC